MNTKQIRAEHRRLAILQILHADSDYSVNDLLLAQLLDELGYGVSSAILFADLAWLDEQDLISLRELSSCRVASLRNNGVDIAKGTASIPGIARPRPQ